MFTLTMLEGALLVTGILAVTIVLLLGVLFVFPRSRREIAGYVTCPVLSRRLGARLVREDWTRRCEKVVRCDALGRYAPVTCNQRCLRTRVTVRA
jgi:hypothetical protein